MAGAGAASTGLASTTTGSSMASSLNSTRAVPFWMQSCSFSTSSLHCRATSGALAPRITCSSVFFPFSPPKNRNCGTQVPRYLAQCAVVRTQRGSRATSHEDEVGWQTIQLHECGRYEARDHGHGRGGIGHAQKKARPKTSREHKMRKWLRLRGLSDHRAERISRQSV